MAEPAGIAETILDDADFREWNERFEARQRKIRLAPNVKHELNVLAKDGADAAQVVKLLALVVPYDNASSIELFKSRKQKLTALADRVERLSKEVEDTLYAPFNSPVFVRFCFFPELAKGFPSEENRKKLSRAASKRMIPIINLLRADAKVFGEMSRIYSRFKRDDVLGGLLRYVKESTGQFHDESMANLLQVAHESLGVDATFSEDQLRVLRRRNFPELTRKRKKPNYLDGPLGLMLGIPPRELDKSDGKK